MANKPIGEMTNEEFAEYLNRVNTVFNDLADAFITDVFMPYMKVISDAVESVATMNGLTVDELAEKLSGDNDE